MLILQIVVLQKVLKSYLCSYTLLEFRTFGNFFVATLIINSF